MKVGDTVIHKKKKTIGKVAGFMKRYPGVLIDWSDRSGVMFRWVHKDNIEVIYESR